MLRRLSLAAAGSAGAFAIYSRRQQLAAAEPAIARPPPAPPPVLSDHRFAGKTVLVTGAGGFLGREGCVYFASRGANVVALDMSQRALDETVAAVATAAAAAGGGGAVRAMVCDVRSKESVDAAVGAGVAAFGRIDACWNNAGMQGAMVPTPEYPLDDFRRVLDVNVVGAFTVLQAVGKAMAADGGGGAIVNTASVAALRGTPTMVAYVASKSAVIGMTTATAKDLAPDGIRVNAISPALLGPGFMWDNQNKLHAASGSPYFSRDPDAVAAAKINAVPLKRLGTSSEVVQAVAYLLSDDSSYVTGANLVVSGGLA